MSCYSSICHLHRVTAIIFRTSKIQNASTERGEQLLKALIRKRAQCKRNAIESKPFNDSKKKASISANAHINHGGMELLKVVGKGTEKLSIKESKCKSDIAHSKLFCFCSPTTHEGWFRCRLHRSIGAAKNKAKATEKSNLRLLCSKHTQHGVVEFKPQLSRFGRIASAEVRETT